MVHLGDITKMSGYTIPPVDVITFGSPCQDYAEFGIIRTSPLPGKGPVWPENALGCSLRLSASSVK